MKKELAKIKEARLNMGRNTFLTFWITLDYENGGQQGFGGGGQFLIPEWHNEWFGEGDTNV